MPNLPYAIDMERNARMTVSTVSMAGDITRVNLDGRLDIQGAAAIDLRMNVLAGSSRFLLLDLSKVSFLGSMGLRSIVLPAQAAKRRGGKMVILAPVPMVEEVLKASNIDEIIPIFHDLDAAVAALR
jgi:anti-anti-sigma factor